LSHKFSILVSSGRLEVSVSSFLGCIGALPVLSLLSLHFRVGFLPWQKVFLPGQWKKNGKTNKNWNILRRGGNVFRRVMLYAKILPIGLLVMFVEW